MRCVLTDSNMTRLPIRVMFCTRSPLLNVSTYSPSVLTTMTGRSKMRVSMDFSSQPNPPNPLPPDGRGWQQIYPRDGLDGRLQALSFGRFATIWPRVAVPSGNSVTNSQPSSPSLFRLVCSSLELWNGSQRYSHFCITTRFSPAPSALTASVPRAVDVVRFGSNAAVLPRAANDSVLSSRLWWIRHALLFLRVRLQGYSVLLKRANRLSPKFGVLFVSRYLPKFLYCRRAHLSQSLKRHCASVFLFFAHERQPPNPSAICQPPRTARMGILYASKALRAPNLKSASSILRFHSAHTSYVIAM